MARFDLERVLVALDGSPRADAILSAVDRFPNPALTELVLLRVVARHSLRPSAEREADLHGAVGHLANLEKRLCEAGRKAHHYLCSGDPAERILEAVDLLRPSLVAMSAHGAGEPSGPRGRVADAVLSRCPVPVLLGNPQSLPVDPGAGFARIVVALDGSEISARSLDPVAALARADRSEVVLLYVDPDEQDAKAREDVIRPYQRRLQTEGVERVRLRTTRGDPAHEVVEALRAEGPDLLAMTSHARPDPKRRWFGSTAEVVVRHAVCPLLVVRVPAPRA